jgi:hypothetical protein
VFFLLIGALAFLPDQPPHATRATITDVIYTASAYTLRAQVEFRSADGRVGMAFFRADEFVCHVGHSVDAEEVGASLRLRHSGCRRVRPWPWDPTTR